MPVRKLIGFGFAAVALTGCIIIDAEDSGGYHVETQFGIPDLRAVDIGKEAVTIRMDSNGCTTKDTVEASVDQDGRNEYEIAFDRIQEDRCRAYLPEGVELSWTYGELNIPEGAYVRVINDVAN